MITVTFNCSDNLISGFTISGHSGFSEEGSDIVCAAVSSAAYMAANTITEILHIDADVTENDGFMSLSLSKSEAEKSAVVLDGLRLHLTALSEQYTKYIKVKISEV